MARGDFALTVPQMKEAARLYLEEKLSVAQIAPRFDVSRCAVQNALAYLGVPSRTPLEGRLLRFGAMRQHTTSMEHRT